MCPLPNSSPAIVELHVNSKSKVHFTFIRIRHDSRHPTMHEEVTGPSNNRHISSLVHKRISSHKVNRTLVLGAIKAEGETQPSGESVLSVVQVHPLSPTNRWGMKIVVEGDWVVENCYVPEMELASQDGPVGSLGRCDDG
ncbi:hypothetical protein LINPERHAP1_LOCUS14384 [Linum perenne]